MEPFVKSAGGVCKSQSAAQYFFPKKDYVNMQCQSNANRYGAKLTIDFIFLE